MVNTKILLSVVIVLLIGIAAASVQINSNSPNLWTLTTPQDTPNEQNQNTQSGQTQTGAQEGTSTVSEQSGDGGNNMKISSDEAQSIVQTQYIEQEGAVAGTPKLVKDGNNSYYIVPIMMNGEKQGEINIDAQTGKNIGGAGGAP